MPLLRFPPDHIVGTLDWVGSYSQETGPTMAIGNVLAPDDQEIHLNVEYSDAPVRVAGGWSTTGSGGPVDLTFLTGLPPASINRLSLSSVIAESFPAVLHLRSGLRRLTLAWSDLDDSVLPVIAQLSGLVSLQTFGNRFTDGGVQQLAVLTELKHLHLEEETLTAAAFGFASHLPKLVRLGLQDVPISTDELEGLRAALPGVRVG